MVPLFVLPFKVLVVLANVFLCFGNSEQYPYNKKINKQTSIA
jgi:hypothetical protein